MKPIEQLRQIYLRNSRRIFALLLIALSLSCATVIVNSANRTDTVWAASGEISAGEVLTRSDIVPVHVLLKELTGHYIPSAQSIVGSAAVRPLSSGDLISRRAISDIADVLAYRSVPLQITRNDLPGDLQPGESVDIYALPIRTSISGSSDQVVDVAHAIAIEAIDLKARDLGGSIGVVIRMRAENILNFLADTANSRIVLVRSGR